MRQPIDGAPAMLGKTTMKFSHVKPGDTDFKGEGLRDFFTYRDLGVADATAGKVLAQLVRSNNAPDMEYLEVVGPADFTSADATGPCDVPAPTPWK
jgi:hypothetical protein